MIRFSLACARAHQFDGWFRDSGDFDRQSAKKLIACPTCGSTDVAKELMAPAVSTGRKREQMALAVSAEQKKAMSDLKALTRKMRENADYVGGNFAEEARKIHFGEVEARGIYGEATSEEARSLAEDGVEFMPLPTFPDDHN